MTGSVQRLVRVALIAAVVIIYLAAVGLFEQFSEVYAIGTTISLARVFFGLPIILAGWLVTRPVVEGGVRRIFSPVEAGGRGGVAGLLSGVVVGGVMVLIDAVGVDKVRDIFIAVSPRLQEIMSFGRSTGAGLLIWAVFGIVMGVLGAVLRVLPHRARNIVLTGPLTIIALGLLQRVVSTAIKELGRNPDWLYDRATKGVTWTGGIGVAAAATLVVVARQQWQSRAAATQPAISTADSTAGSGPSPRKIGRWVAGLALLLALPQIIGTALSGTMGTVLIFVLLGLGLNIVVGFAGLLDLGYVAFFAFGAYATALLTGASVNTSDGAADPNFFLNLNYYVAVPFVVLLAAGLGLMIGAPVLRLRGDYLAIVTLGLGEVVYTLVTSRWAQGLVGGPQGMRNITGGDIGSTDFQNNPRHFYYLALAFVAAALYVSWRLQYSRIGRAWNAMREDEQVADAMGISTTRYKLLAFATGGAIGSLGGSLLAVQLGSITPRSFDVNVSILALAIVILGGMGSLRGVIVGALALVGLPGFLREFEEFRPLALGAVIIAIMLLRPQGLLPNVRETEDIADADRDQDAWADAAAAAQAESGA